MRVHHVNLVARIDELVTAAITRAGEIFTRIFLNNDGNSISIQHISTVTNNQFFLLQRFGHFWIFIDSREPVCEVRAG
ncbi:hypothetical protein HZ504_003079 [Salmonella enterica]|nr:hypothetical protein [Salmonella enterica]EIF8840848.1 hypothetical protein [Salmonella enterica]